MAKQAYVYSGTDWVPLASEVTNLTAYQTKALAQAPYRNLIINGAMTVAQRNTSVASITTSGYRTADRYRVAISSQGTWTQSVENDAPTGSGFRNSLKMLCTTADASPAAGDEISIQQNIEGQNIQHIKKGTAAAEQLTLSFWVKSNVTGTYVVNIADVDNSREVSKSYTINTSGTWEREVITFPADTTGAFDNDNGLSLSLSFGLGAGSNYTSGTLQQTWASNTAANRFVGQTNLASATNNYWQITGVQLEVGDTATPFEFKHISDDFRQCQRYYEHNYDPGTYPGANNPAGLNNYISFYGSTDSAGNIVIPYKFNVQKRTAPTMTYYNNAGTSGVIAYYRNGASGNPAATSYRLGVHNGHVYGNTGSGFVVAFGEVFFVADAEL
jgi:hypothetical protein